MKRPAKRTKSPAKWKKSPAKKRRAPDAKPYTRVEGRFAKLLLMPSYFAKLLEAIFSCFVKIIWMPSWDSKLLEMLLVSASEDKLDEFPVRCRGI